MRLADRLHMSKQRCQQETTSTEFLDWLVFIDKELNGFHRIDYFLANIARILVQVNADKGQKIELEPFLLKFKKESQVTEMTEEQIQEKIEKSKSTWMAITQLSMKNKKRRLPPKRNPNKEKLQRELSNKDKKVKDVDSSPRNTRRPLRD